MSLEQFGRSFILEAGSKKIESVGGSLALRIAFRIERDKSTVPNNAEVAIWNLSRDSREALEQQEDQSVRLQVGYQDKISQIFLGSCRRVDTSREGTDFITRLSAGDGEDKMASNEVHRTFAKGTKITDAMGIMIDAVGLGRGNFGELVARLSTKIALKSGANKFEKAYTVSGGAAEELSRLTRSCGLEWSIQDGNFLIHAVGKPASQERGPLITPDTGLVGQPKVAAGRAAKGKKSAVPKGQITFQALLIPDLTPGMAVRIESDKVSGNYHVIQTKHWGDSWSKDWYVEGVGNPL